jgi:steroid 5-alpha reductase family enzyme
MSALIAALLVAVAAWAASLRLRDVSIVDGLWSLMILLCLLVYAALAEHTGSKSWQARRPPVPGHPGKQSAEF